mmetsp:Transcript_26957/g.42111  ORF Transcript_26957/g.42111 Transcript_26957/m.42111 type:complete len:149 (+) Transcript_26957:1229-1675(+)
MFTGLSDTDNAWQNFATIDNDGQELIRLHGDWVMLGDDFGFPLLAYNRPVYYLAAVKYGTEDFNTNGLQYIHNRYSHQVLNLFLFFDGSRWVVADFYYFKINPGDLDSLRKLIPTLHTMEDTIRWEETQFSSKDNRGYSQFFSGSDIA